MKTNGAVEVNEVVADATQALAMPGGDPVMEYIAKDDENQERYVGSPTSAEKDNVESARLMMDVDAMLSAPDDYLPQEHEAALKALNRQYMLTDEALLNFTTRFGGDEAKPSELLRKYVDKINEVGNILSTPIGPRTDEAADEETKRVFAAASKVLGDAFGAADYVDSRAAMANMSREEQAEYAKDWLVRNGKIDFTDEDDREMLFMQGADATEAEKRRWEAQLEGEDKEILHGQWDKELVERIEKDNTYYASIYAREAQRRADAVRGKAEYEDEPSKRYAAYVDRRNKWVHEQRMIDRMAKAQAHERDFTNVMQLIPFLNNAQKQMIADAAEGGDLEVYRGMFKLMDDKTRETMQYMMSAVRPEAAPTFASGLSLGTKKAANAVSDFAAGMYYQAFKDATAQDELEAEQRFNREFNNTLGWERLKDPSGVWEKAWSGFGQSTPMTGSSIGGAMFTYAAKAVPHPLAKVGLYALGRGLQGFGILSMAGDEYENLLDNGVRREDALALALAAGGVNWLIENMNTDRILGAGLTGSELMRIGLISSVKAASRGFLAKGVDKAVVAEARREFARTLKANGAAAFKIMISETFEEMLQGLNSKGVEVFAKGEKPLLSAFVSEEALDAAAESFEEALPTCTLFGAFGALMPAGAMFGLNQNGARRNAFGRMEEQLDALLDEKVRTLALDEKGAEFVANEKAKWKAIYRNRAAQVVGATAQMNPSEATRWLNSQDDMTIAERAFYADMVDFNRAATLQVGAEAAKAYASGNLQLFRYEKGGAKFDIDTKSGRVTGVTYKTGEKTAEGEDETVHLNIVDMTGQDASIDDVDESVVADFIKQYNQEVEAGEIKAEKFSGDYRQMDESEKARLTDEFLNRANGWYNKDENTVYLTNRATAGTLAHESSHATIFDILENAILKQGLRSASAVQRIKRGVQRRGSLPGIDYDESTAQAVGRIADAVVESPVELFDSTDMVSAVRNVGRFVGNIFRGEGNKAEYLPVFNSKEARGISTEGIMNTLIDMYLPEAVAEEEARQRRNAEDKARGIERRGGNTEEAVSLRQRKIDARVASRRAEAERKAQELKAREEALKRQAEEEIAKKHEELKKKALAIRERNRAEAEFKAMWQERLAILEDQRKAAEAVANYEQWKNEEAHKEKVRAAQEKLLAEVVAEIDAEEKAQAAAEEKAFAAEEKRKNEQMLKNRKQAVKNPPRLGWFKNQDGETAQRCRAAYLFMWKAKMGMVVTQKEMDAIGAEYGLPPEALNLKKVKNGYRLQEGQMLSDESLAKLNDALVRFHSDVHSVKIIVPDVVVSTVEEVANAVPNEVYDPVSNTFITGRVVVSKDAKSLREQAGLEEPTVSPAEVEEAMRTRFSISALANGMGALLAATNVVNVADASLNRIQIIEDAEAEKMMAGGDGIRKDGTHKGLGFFGPLKMPNGSIMTEFATGFTIDGKEVEVPLVNPLLSYEELAYLTNGYIVDSDPIMESIFRKGAEWGAKRLKEGRSPFIEESEKRTPIPAATKTRFSLVTPAEDAAYLDAVKRGDMDTAQRMVREAAAKAMPDTKVVDEDGLPLVVYHGTKHQFTKFAPLSHFGGNIEQSLDRLGFYHDQEDFNEVSLDELESRAKSDGAQIMRGFLNIKNPLIIDVDLGSWEAKEFEKRGLSLDGHDGVVYDNWHEGRDSEINPAYIIMSPTQIKSADPVTYDDNGNVIPLSQRFNPRKSDIRFSLKLNALSLEEAKKQISAQKNIPFRNFFTDLEVTLSSSAEGKLVSKKAAMKSVKNGFTFEQHNAMAANVGELFERGFEAVVRGDKDGDANIKSIRRYACPVLFDDKRAFAWITVKESKQHGAKIYSVESIELEAFSRKVEEELMLTPHALNAPTARKVPQSASAVNGGTSFSISSAMPEGYDGVDAEGRTRFSLNDDHADRVAALIGALGILKGERLDARVYDRIRRSVRSNISIPDLARESEYIAEENRNILNTIASDRKRDKVLEQAGMLGKHLRAIERSRRADLLFATSVQKKTDRLNRANERVLRDIKGFTADTILNEMGIDPLSLLMALEPEERATPKAKAQGTAEGSAENSANPEVPSALTASQLNIAANRVKELLANVREKLARAKQEAENNPIEVDEDGVQKRKNEPSSASDDNAIETDAADEAVGTMMSNAIVAGIRASGITIDDAAEMVKLAEVITEEHIRKNPSLYQGIILEDIWSDPRALALLGGNISRFAQMTAEAYCPTFTKTRVTKYAQMLDDKAVRTLEAIEELGVRMFRDLNRDVVRESRKSLIKKIHRKIDALAKSHEENRLNTDRKVSSALSAYLKKVKKAIDMSQAKVEERIAELELLCTTRYQGVSPEVADHYRDYSEAQDELYILSDWGNLKRRMPSEIKEKYENLDQLVNEDLYQMMQVREQHQAMIEEMSSAIANGIAPDPKNKGKQPTNDPLSYSLVGLFEAKARQLIRFNKNPAAVAEARRAFAWLEQMIQDSLNAQTNFRNEYQEKFRNLLVECYGSERKAKKALSEKFDAPWYWVKMEGDSYPQTEDDKGLTAKRALQMYVSIVQDDYIDNVEKWGRGGEYRTNLEKMLGLVDEDGNYNADSPHAKFVEGMRAIYLEMGDRLDSVLFETTGTHLRTPNRNYMPVEMDRRVNRGKTGEGRAFSPFAPSLVPRIKHGRDFKQKADITEVFIQRLNDTAHTIGFAKSGNIIMQVAQSDRVINAIERAFGSEEAKRWNNRIFNIVAGPDVKSGRERKVMLALMKYASRLLLAMNLASWAKQLTSIGALVLSNEVTLRDVAAGLSMWALKPIQMLRVAHDLASSDAFKARYGAAISNELRYAISDDGAFRSWTQKVVSASMSGVQQFDKLGVLMAAGVYYRRRQQLEMQGKSQSEAADLASRWIMSIVDKTMQSGRTLNLTEAQLDGGVAAFLQFKSAPLQQAQFEIVAYQEWAADKGNMEKLGKLVTTIVANHMLTPFGMAIVDAAMAFVTSWGVPDEEKRERLYTRLLGETLAGPFGSLFIIGAFVEYGADVVSRSITGAKKLYGSGVGQLVPAEGALRFVADFIDDIIDASSEIRNEEYMDALANIGLAVAKIIPGTSAPTRIGEKIHKSINGDEKKRKKRNKSALRLSR